MKSFFKIFLLTGFYFFNLQSRSVYLPEALVHKYPHISQVSAFTAGIITKHVYDNGIKNSVQPLLLVAALPIRHPGKTVASITAVAIAAKLAKERLIAMCTTSSWDNIE